MHRSRVLHPARAALTATAAVVALAAGGIALPASSLARPADHAPSAPTGLRVDDQHAPLAVADTPHFGWLPRDRDANEVQSAYQLVVSTDKGRRVWGSGKVRSSAESWVAYAGPRLKPGTTYAWSVRTWDRSGKVSPYAQARFDTALGDTDWSGAQWIRRTPAPGNDTANDWTLARSTVDVSEGSPVVRARAYVAAMADWQLHVDGHTVDRTSSPDYPGEGFYDVTDLTSLAHAGRPLAVGVAYHYNTCTCQGRANGPVSPEGPSGLLAKVVVEHADGTRDLLVSNGTWKVTRDASEGINTLTYRNGDSGDRVEYIDARAALRGWDTAGYDDSAWSAPAVIGPHPRPQAADCSKYEGGSSPCTFTHLVPEQAHVATSVIHPRSVVHLPDGSTFADFGKVYASVPAISLQDGKSGTAVTVTTSYRENNTTTTAPTSHGATTVPLVSTANMHVGDVVTVDAPADGYGAGHPEQRAIAGVGASSITLTRPLYGAHRAGVWVENSRAGTSKLDTQNSNMRFFYTERDGAQTARPEKYWAWRYVEISDTGQRLTRGDISAVTQHTNAPNGHASTFASSNPTLNKVFDLMQRSALYTAQDTFVDTPTREKGQFLGDSEDISMATMSSLDERLLTRQAIVDFAESQARYWPNGALNAVYPNGDAKRDIPDYTEMYDEWVMDYYQQTGDTSLLAQVYPVMKNVADYIDAAVDETGLVDELPGGSGPYEHGIIDWPAPMRYDTVVDGNGAETVVNALAVGADRALAKASNVLGRGGVAHTYSSRAAALTKAMNASLYDKTSGQYSDGLATDTHARIGNYSEHAQSYPLAYGVAPASTYRHLGTVLNRDGMQHGPMDLRQLEAALGLTGRTDTLVRILTDRRTDGPAQTIAEGGTFMPELWRPGCQVAGCSTTQVDQGDSASMSHGWGSAGILGIQQSLLGVTVTGAGAARLRIEPPSRGLRAAHGTEWTERGPVRVAWSWKGGTLHMSATVPDNVTAVVVVGSHRRTIGSGTTRLHLAR